MADIGRALISKVVDYNDITTAMRAGIRASWFEDPDQRAIWKWMTEYYQRYSEVPTAVALKADFPNFKLSSAEEPYQYYIDKFRDMHTRAILMDTLIDAHEQIEKHEDTKAAQERLSKGLVRLGQEVSVLTDVNVVDAQQIEERFERYREPYGG